MMRTTQATSVLHVLTKSTFLALRLLYLMTQETKIIKNNMIYMKNIP